MTDGLFIFKPPLEPRLYLRADFAALTGSTVSRRRQISRWSGVEKREREREREREQADAGFLAGSSLPAIFWYLAPASSPLLLPAACFLRLLLLSASFSLPYCKKIDVYVHTKGNKRARWIVEAGKVGFIRRSRQVGKIRGNRFSPLPPLAGSSRRFRNRSRRSQVGDRVLLAWPDAAEEQRKRPSSDITQIAPLRIMGLEKIADRSCRMMSSRGSLQHTVRD